MHCASTSIEPQTPSSVLHPLINLSLVQIDDNTALQFQQARATAEKEQLFHCNQWWWLNPQSNRQSMSLPAPLVGFQLRWRAAATVAVERHQKHICNNTALVSAVYPLWQLILPPSQRTRSILLHSQIRVRDKLWSHLCDSFLGANTNRLRHSLMHHIKFIALTSWKEYTQLLQSKAVTSWFIATQQIQKITQTIKTREAGKQAMHCYHCNMHFSIVHAVCVCACVCVLALDLHSSVTKVKPVGNTLEPSYILIELTGNCTIQQ